MLPSGCPRVPVLSAASMTRRDCREAGRSQAIFLSPALCTSSNATSPAGSAGEVRRGRGHLLRNHKVGAVFPPPTGCLSEPAPGDFSITAARLCIQTLPWEEPLGVLGWQRGALSPASRRRHCWQPGGSRRSGPPGSRAISLSFQAPAVCPWDVGWRHPRPVAANDGNSITTRGTYGDRDVVCLPWLPAVRLNAVSTERIG